MVWYGHHMRGVAWQAWQGVYQQCPVQSGVRAGLLSPAGRNEFVMRDRPLINPGAYKVADAAAAVHTIVIYACYLLQC